MDFVQDQERAEKVRKGNPKLYEDLFLAGTSINDEKYLQTY